MNRAISYEVTSPLSDSPRIDLLPPGPDLVRMIRSPAAIELAAQLESKAKNKSVPISSQLAAEIQRWMTDVLWGTCRTLTLKYKNNYVPCRSLAGHLWSSEELGPVHADVMVVNKLTYNDDVAANASMLGETSLLFYSHLCDKGLDPSNWYVTNFVKTQHPEWDLKSTTLTAGMIAEFKPILQQEILLVQPKLILCLGTEALSAVLGKKVTMTASTNVVYPMTWFFPVFDGDEIVNVVDHTVHVIGIPHPHAVLRKGDSGSLDDLNAHIEFFVQNLNSLVHKQEIIHYKEEGLDHRVITSLEQLQDIADEIEATCEDNLIAVDSEWNGSHPQNQNSYLRCMQIAWKHKASACLALAPQTEDCSLAKLYYYKGREMDKFLDIVRRITAGKRIAGHFIDADLEHLLPFGLDLLKNFDVPDSWEAYRDAWKNNQPCGFDTGRAIHAISETADFSLKTQAREHTEAGRYDKGLDDWLAANTTKKQLDGYGIIPDEILYKYANYDADVTRRLAVIYGEMLDADEFGNNCWRPFWYSMRALPAILEMNCTGMPFSWERLKELTDQYTTKADRLIGEIREWARWPDFNPRSAFHMRELLFGVKYNRKTLSEAEKKKLPPGTLPPEYIRIRPPGAKSMELPPLLTTGKYPRKWTDVVNAGRDHLATPSTDKKTIAQLLFFNHKREVVDTNGRTRTLNFKPVLEKLRNWNTVAQTLRYVLKPPVKNEDTGEPVTDDDGNVLYDAGIPNCVCDDNKVRTHIWPTKATGRWSSSQPSLQNLGKGVEELLKDIFKEEYKYPLRSIFKAEPGWYFIEADYTGAEIASAAYMCNDTQMLEHVRRNQLPESDPDHYDIHSHVAVSAFKLNCEPSKQGLKNIGKKHFRELSKKVIFGIFYGRSPRAIAEGARSEGFIVSEEDAKAIVMQLQTTYPKLLGYFDQCAARITSHRWLANAFGRYRRFPEPLDDEQRKRFERQAKNFPIQGLVADVVNQAASHLYRLRNKLNLYGKFVLSIHDAIMVYCPKSEVKVIYEELLPIGMVRSVPIFSTDFDGHPLVNHSPRYFGIDRNVFTEWGSPIDDLSQFGIQKT